MFAVSNGFPLPAVASRNIAYANLQRLVETLANFLDLMAYHLLTFKFFFLQSTGIGKSVNNLRKKGGSIALLSKALVKKWKSLVPTENFSPVKKSSPLNTSQPDFKTEHCKASSTKKLPHNCPKKETKIKQKERLANKSDVEERKSIIKQKVN